MMMMMMIMDLPVPTRQAIFAPMSSLLWSLVGFARCNSTGDTRQKGLQDTIHTTTRACKSRPLFRGNPVRFHTRIASSAASALLVVLFVVLKTLSVEAAVVVVAVAGVVVVMDGLDGVIHDAVFMRVSDVIPYGQLVVRP